MAGRTVHRLSPSELEEHRHSGQCFNCDEKYVRGHNRACARLFTMEVADHEDDDPATDYNIESQPQISLHAIAGVRTRDTMQVVVQLGRVTVTTLIDSGSTHNFVSKVVAT